MKVRPLTICTISGSLRQRSLNTMLLRAMSSLAPTNVFVTSYAGMGAIPPFNPDFEGNEPAPVLHFRASLLEADGVVICSPEYAHGVSGVLKNALDWVVSSGELSKGKPVAVINASYSSHFADDQLREILKTMDAKVIEGASVTISVQGTGVDETALINHPVLGTQLRSALEKLVVAIRSKWFSGQSLSLSDSKLYFTRVKIEYLILSGYNY